jgi:hypothetical protein
MATKRPEVHSEKRIRNEVNTVPKIYMLSIVCAYEHESIAV